MTGPWETALWRGRRLRGRRLFRGGGLLVRQLLLRLSPYQEGREAPAAKSAKTDTTVPSQLAPSHWPPR